MPQPYIWVHEDALSRNHLVFETAGENARAVFIWDSAYFERQAYSLKRLTFIYECLIDMQQGGADGAKLNLEVFHGDTETILREFCISEGQENNPLYMADTPNLVFLKIANKLGQDIPVEMVKNSPFIEVPDDVDMTRFFRFWNRSRRSALGFEPQT